jgi:hypothetical protein
MASFAIICEGISENLSLHAIIEKMSQTDSYFADIQPRTEMSHGHSVQEGSGGWTEVLSHCNTEEFQMALQNNDYLVVQIDTDRCDEKPFGIKKVDENNQPRTDEDVYNDIITRLLQDVDNDFYEVNKERIIFAICFDEIECWFLPLFYSDKRACATTGCIDKLNQELRKDKGGYYIPEKGKNGANARSTYQFVLKKIKRKDIPRISQYNFGFQKFVEQMGSIKEEIAETE